MRKVKLYQLLAVAGGLSAAVATTPVFAGPGSTPVVPLNWTAGTATVDGNYSEWDLSADASTIMCERGAVKTDGTCDGKVQLSTLYTRYNCDTNTMYVLVLEAAGHEATPVKNDAWVKIYDLSQSPQVDGNSSNFAWVGNTDGYEASFTLAAGTYNDVQIHLNVDNGKTSSTGKISVTRSITVPVSCTMPVVPVVDDTPVDDTPVDDTPVDDTPVDDTPVDDTPVDDTPVDDTPVDDTPVDDTPVDDTPVDDTPVDDTPVDNGGGPNVLCSEIVASNGGPMSLITKFEWTGGGYARESGTDAIDISGDASGGEWSVNDANEGIVDVDAVIIKGATGTYIYNYEPGAKVSDIFSKMNLPLNNGGQVPDISNVQFCQDGVLNGGDEVCLTVAGYSAPACVFIPEGTAYTISIDDAKYDVVAE